MGYHEYMEFDVEINNINREEEIWFRNLLRYDIEFLEESEKDGSLGVDYKVYFKNEEQMFPGFDHCFKNSGTTIQLYASENAWDAGPVQLARVLQSFISIFRPKEVIKFHWVCWDNRGKDTYNGGAYIVYATRVKSIDLKKWLEANA